MSDAHRFTKRDLFVISNILLITIITPFVADSYTPSMPAIAKAFHATNDQIQYTITYYLFGVSFSQLFYGPLSDRYGRKPIVLFGLVILIASSISCAWATSVRYLLLSRLGQGIGAGVCNAIFRASLRDSFKSSKMAKAGSYIGMCFTTVYAIAPVLGGYIETYFGWRANFYFVTFIVSLIFVLLILFLPETNLAKLSEIKIKNTLRHYISLLRSPIFVGFSLISSVGYSGLTAYYTAAPFIMQNTLKLTPIQFGLLSIVIAAGMFTGQYTNAQLVVRKGATKMLLVGLFGMTLGGLVMLTLGMMHYLNTYVVIIPVFIYSISAGLVFSNAMTHAFYSFGHIAGTAAAVYGCLQILGSAITSIFVAGLSEKTQVPLALVFTGLGLSALFIFYSLVFFDKKVVFD